jgi:hypothetical protein
MTALVLLMDSLNLSLPHPEILSSRSSRQILEALARLEDGPMMI